VSGLLLPEEREVYPLVESSHLLGDPGALQAKAQEDGYLHFREFVPESLLGPVRAFTREAFAKFGWVQGASDNIPQMKAVPNAKLSGRGWDDQDWVQFQPAFSKHPDFLALAESQLVMDILEAILGEPVWLASMNFCLIQLPGSPEHTTLPHQDQWYLPRCDSMWSMWAPLVDMPMEIGPIGVVPGSQQRRVGDHFTAFSGLQVEPKVVWASNDVHAGDVVFFSSRTIHCAWSNMSPTFAQVSADIRYEPRSVGEKSKLRKQQK
jgi:ectoine hydroxylase-related dioxygenase (phytanoyl-CoA dioxygenase family)